MYVVIDTNKLTMKTKSRAGLDGRATDYVDLNGRLEHVCVFGSRQPEKC